MWRRVQAALLLWVLLAPHHRAFVGLVPASVVARAARDGALAGRRGGLAAACSGTSQREGAASGDGETPLPEGLLNQRGAPFSRRAQLWGLAALAGGATAPEGDRPPTLGSPALAVAQLSDEKQASQVFRQATPGVVSMARSFKPGQKPRRKTADEDGLPKATGSGFVWDENHVVTNNHVVEQAGPGGISVIFVEPDGQKEDPPRRRVFPGQVVGADPATDIAVVRVLRGPKPANDTKEEDLALGKRVLARGVSATLDVGQTVYAIGNPFGLDHSMSRGIISGIARTLEIGERPIRGCIQTDASINPGNSGGPLLDSQGRVIGVNTAILTGSGTSSGVGLAIPIDTVSRNVEAIIRQGFVKRAFLGITFAQDEIAESLQLPGLIVVAVVPSSPAQKAGVLPMKNGRLGDVVIAFDGKEVKTGSDLFRFLDKKVPGDMVMLTVQRPVRGQDDGVEQVILNATLSSNPA